MRQVDPFASPEAVGLILGKALYQLRRYPEAANAARNCAQRAPSNSACRALLAAALGQSGAPLAKNAVAELLKISPGFTVADELRRVSAGARGEFPEHYAEGLRKAGVPAG